MRTPKNAYPNDIYICGAHRGADQKTITSATVTKNIKTMKNHYKIKENEQIVCEADHGPDHQERALIRKGFWHVAIYIYVYIIFIIHPGS